MTSQEIEAQAGGGLIALLRRLLPRRRRRPEATAQPTPTPLPPTTGCCCPPVLHTAQTTTLIVVNVGVGGPRRAAEQGALGQPASPDPTSTEDLDAWLDRVMGVPEDEQERSVRVELARQARLAPRTAARLRAVVLIRPEDGDLGAELDEVLADEDPKNGRSASTLHGADGEVYIVFNSYWCTDLENVSRAFREMVQEGWLARHGGDDELGLTTAHEFGHAIESTFFAPGGVLPVKAAARLMPVLSRALGLTHHLAGDVPAAVLDAWVAEHAEVIASRVSGYAATKFHELAAEIWAEWSTRGDRSRDVARAVGPVMLALAEEGAGRDADR